MENERDILLRTIVPFMIWDHDIPYLGTGMPPIGKCGTCFFVQYNNEYYAITAKHCLGDANPTKIFITLPNKEMKGLPISKVIFSEYNDGLGTDTDVVLMKMPILDTIFEKAKPNADKLAQELLNTPYMKRQIRLNKHRTMQEALAKTVESRFYQNMKKHQEQKVLDLVDKAYTEDLRICVFNIKETHKIKNGATCVSLGIPNSDFSIDYANNTIRSIILGVKCNFIEFDTNRQDYVFECNDADKLDGMSGGPIIYDDTVIAMQHSVNVQEKKIYATPITAEFIKNAERV